jgi:uncharacterized protein YceK
MKTAYFLVFSVVVLMTGCASTVKTYDATGKMIGSCEAQKGFIIGGHAYCEGHANQEGK